MLHEYVKLNIGHQPLTLNDCFLDFMLSRQAMLCTTQTLRFYKNTLGLFLKWLESQNVSQPEDVTAKHVRAFLASFAERGCSDSYIHTFARSIRTFLRFLHSEGYIPEPIQFQMPKIGEKRLPVLSIDDVRKALSVCEQSRDRLLLLMMVDTGIRRAEICALNWGDIDIPTGLCMIRKGKGKKYRSVVIGIKTRRCLLKYRQTVNSEDKDPVFQKNNGERLSPLGVRSVLLRISQRAGIYISPHALRRTFVVTALKGGMSIAHVQAIMGHTTPIMTLEYARLVDEDLLSAHHAHGPVDTFFRN